MGARWDFASSEDILAEAASLIPVYSGVTHENLTREYGRQWPCTKERPLGTPRLFADGEKIHPFRFKEMSPVFPEEPEQTEFPFVLWFGHSLYYWLHNTLVQHSEVLKREYGILFLDYPDGFIEVNPDDAKSLNVRDGEKIRLVAPAGEATATARVTAEVRRGVVYVPYFLQDVARRLRGGYKSVEGRTVHVRIEKAV
jgi:formate dehydrogenase major subunit